jgi:hypothetical protein
MIPSHSKKLIGCLSTLTSHIHSLIDRWNSFEYIDEKCSLNINLWEVRLMTKTIDQLRTDWLNCVSILYYLMQEMSNKMTEDSTLAKGQVYMELMEMMSCVSILGESIRHFNEDV